MRTSTASMPTTALTGPARFFRGWSLLLFLLVGTPAAFCSEVIGQTFMTPDDAVVALAAAARAQDTNALRVLFGPAAADLENPDRVQASHEFDAFMEALTRTNRIVHPSDSKCVLEVGEDFWPFPVPIVKRDGLWFFDTEAGKEELLDRRIGRNELAVLQVLRAYVDAQRAYASRDRDGDGVLEYAQRLDSSPGTTDGLYWPTDLNGEVSPLGPLVASAQGAGYDLESKAGAPDRAPFHGYFFKILTRQGKQAPGGRYDYIINGNMIGGFALVAWPAEYGSSGVMTFIVNQQGRVFQQNLGRNTVRIARRMTAYDPGSGWSPCSD